MTPAFRILPIVVMSLLVMIGMRGLEMWTGLSAVGTAHAGDADGAAAQPPVATAPASAPTAQAANPNAAPVQQSVAANADAAASPAASPTSPVDAAANLPAPSGTGAAQPAASTSSADAKDTNIPALATSDPSDRTIQTASAAATAPAPPVNVVVARPKIPGEEDFTSASEIEVLSSLTKRREELDKRSAELDMREKLMEATEQRLDQKLAEIKAVETQIQTTVHTLNDNQERQIVSLVKVYENMKPKDAAVIMQDLDRTILIEVAARIKEAKMAPILAAMDPQKAREVTVLLAKRNEVPGQNG